MFDLFRHLSLIIHPIHPHLVERRTWYASSTFKNLFEKLNKAGLKSGEITDKCTLKRNSHRIYMSTEVKQLRRDATSVNTMRNMVTVA